MTTDPTESAAIERIRLEKRLSYATGITFHGASGVVLHGQTTDVSLSGAFMHTLVPPTQVTPGESGDVELFIREPDGEYTVAFPCRVARVTKDGLGLSFDEEE